MVLFVGVLRSMGACDPYLVAFARGKWSSSDTNVQRNHRAQDLYSVEVIKALEISHLMSHKFDAQKRDIFTSFVIFADFQMKLVSMLNC